MTNTSTTTSFLKWDIAVFLTTIVWASTFPLIKVFAVEFDPITGMFYRFVIASALLGVWLMFKKKNLWLHFREGAILGAMVWVVYASQMIGLRHTTASNSAFVTSLFVVFVPFFDWLAKGKRVTGLQILVLCVACVGVWLLTGGVAQINVGDLITLVTAIMSAAHLVRLEMKTQVLPSVTILSFQQFFVAALITFVWLMMEGFLSGSVLRGFVVPDAKIWGTVVYLAIFPTIITWMILTVAQAKTSPFRVGVILLFESVFASIMAWGIGLELMSMTQIVGAGLILMACFMNMLPQKRPVAAVESMLVLDQ